MRALPDCLGAGSGKLKPHRARHRSPPALWQRVPVTPSSIHRSASAARPPARDPGRRGAPVGRAGRRGRSCLREAIFPAMEACEATPTVMTSISDAMGRGLVAGLAARHPRAGIHEVRSGVRPGGPMCYNSTPTTGTAAATCVAEVVNGTQPAGLPVEQPAPFERVTSLTPPKALGLTPPGPRSPGRIRRSGSNPGVSAAGSGATAPTPSAHDSPRGRAGVADVGRTQDTLTAAGHCRGDAAWQRCGGRGEILRNHA